MKSHQRIVKTALLAFGLGLWTAAHAAVPADPQPHKAPQANAAAAGKTAPAAKKAPARQVVLVDINSATKEELKKLPHIGDAEAGRIIAGRPYLSKAHLQTHNVVSPAVYQDLRELVVARQKDAKFGKAGK
jgi:competence protein ComEA